MLLVRCQSCCFLSLWINYILLHKQGTSSFVEAAVYERLISLPEQDHIHSSQLKANPSVSALVELAPRAGGMYSTRSWYGYLLLFFDNTATSRWRRHPSPVNKENRLNLPAEMLHSAYNCRPRYNLEVSSSKSLPCVPCHPQTAGH